MFFSPSALRAKTGGSRLDVFSSKLPLQGSSVLEKRREASSRSLNKTRTQVDNELEIVRKSVKEKKTDASEISTPPRSFFLP